MWLAGRVARVSDSATLPGLDDALALGLTESEYGLICEKQGAPPNQVELAMYSLLWSEHCAYKHSKKLLRTLPTEGPHVVMGPGENAGAVDLGDGLVCAFKVESHNHPSAVEPFQGAATGVGGILRDIFAIGARPIAVLDSLRFGEPRPADGSAPVPGGEGSRARYLLDRAVAGIGHYGNSIGVPTIGGEVYFEAPYEQNCLVNAMALGIAKREQLVTSAAVGIGNVVLLFGASTGRDGIGGASVLASAELGEDDDKRPTVQVGDPFEEKKLMECSLELLEHGLLVSLQDLGAAGLTSSASEMASKGEVGIDIDVAKVPLREPDMEPFEIMVSESQERMLCVVEPTKVDAVLELCEKWEVSGAPIGAVTDTGQMRVFKDSVLVGSMPVRALVDDCPLYDLEPGKPTGTTYPAPQALLPPNPPKGTCQAGEPSQAVGRGTSCCSHCFPRPTSPRAGPCSSSTTRLFSRARSDVPSSLMQRFWRSARLGIAPRPPLLKRRGVVRESLAGRSPGSPFRSTATAGVSRPTLTPARSRRSWSALQISPAPGPSRSAPLTTSTSATPRSPTSLGS